MGFNPVKALTSGLGGIAGILVGNALKPQKQAAAPAAAAPASSADDVAREEERRRLLARGLTATGATSPLGDTSAANIGRKALLGV